MFRKQPAPDSTRLLPAGLQGFQLRGGSELAACLQTYTRVLPRFVQQHTAHTTPVHQNTCLPQQSWR